MKVMCIEQPEEWAMIAAFFGGSFPDVMDECVVKETRRCTCGTHDVYVLDGYYLPCGFDPTCFAILPEADADEIDAAEQEAIVPNPLMVESDPISIEEKAISAYYQVYEITGCERRAAEAYFQTIQNSMA
jgi:hypothetical protein